MMTARAFDLTDLLNLPTIPATWPNSIALDECRNPKSCDTFEHVHCSGCAEVIRLQQEDAGSIALPPDANICTCGRVKHRHCECAARC